MATNKDLKRWYSGKSAGPKDFARLDDTGKIPPSQCPSEGSGFVITATSNKTVNGLQVPSLTDAQLHQIYNATVQGVAVTITDATGKMHFSGVTADSVSNDIFVSFLYFDKMVLEYGEGDVTTFKEIGSSGGSVDGELITSFTFADDQEKFVSLGGEYKRVFIEFNHSEADYEDNAIWVTTELTVAASMLNYVAPFIPVKFIDHSGWASCLIDVSTGSAVMIGTWQNDQTNSDNVEMTTMGLAQNTISYVRFIGSQGQYSYTAAAIPSTISVKIYGVK